MTAPTVAEFAAMDATPPDRAEFQRLQRRERELLARVAELVTVNQDLTDALTAARRTVEEQQDAIQDANLTRRPDALDAGPAAAQQPMPRIGGAA